MQNSKLTKTMLKYLSVLAVLATTVIGLFMGKDLYQTSLDSQSKAPTIILGTVNPCVAIYLTQPPKCKTLDGKFIPLPRSAPFIMVTPEDK